MNYFKTILVFTCMMAISPSVTKALQVSSATSCHQQCTEKHGIMALIARIAEIIEGCQDYPGAVVDNYCVSEGMCTDGEVEDYVLPGTHRYACSVPPSSSADPEINIRSQYLTDLTACLRDCAPGEPDIEGKY